MVDWVATGEILVAYGKGSYLGFWVLAWPVVKQGDSAGAVGQDGGGWLEVGTAQMLSTL